MPISDDRGRPRGIIVRDAHFPERAPIDAYGNGGFRFAEMSHRGSILCVPSGIYGWSPATTDDLTLAAFERVVAEAAEIDLVLAGTGTSLVPLTAEVGDALRAAGVRFEVMATGAAVRTYNVLLAEDRRVAAALLAIE